jgi:hypothetical protein
MIPSLVFAALLVQAPARPLPDHVQLLPPERPQPSFAERLPGKARNPLFSLTAPSKATIVVQGGKEVCATMIVIPADADVDPKMALEMKMEMKDPQSKMPLFRGIEPCNNKLP